MKRLIIPGLVLLALLALYQWGNRILEQTLDAELPKLLSRELGIPVTLGPTRTWIPTLTVHSPKLIMGDPASPALVATGVTVSLDWSDLLHGEIRLRRATGAKLMVKPSQWPGNDDPWPADYRFIDPYLPDYLTLESASYVGADGDTFSFSNPQWRRQAPGATLSWRDDNSGQAADITISLSSLDDLLHLAALKLQITAAASGKENATVDVALELQPGKPSGYSLSARVNAAGMTAAVATGNSNSWQLPDQSSTTIKQLDIEKLRALVAAYRADTASDGVSELLASPLPRLSLPGHKGHVAIDEIRWRDEVGTNSTFDFITGPDGVSVPTLSSKGPEGALSGQLDITSSDSGWQLAATANLQAATTDKSLATPYLDADWFWREGNGRLKGQGSTWGTLLNSLQGDIALSGSHRGAVKTPVTVTAALGQSPGEFSLDMIEIKLAQGRITGSVVLSGDDRKRLSGKIRAEQVNLDFLLPEKDPAALPGLALPTFLAMLPGMDLDWQLDVASLSVSDLDISQTRITFTRTPEQGSFSAQVRGSDSALLDLQLNASMFPDKPSEVTLQTDLTNFNFSKLFQQTPVFLDSRTSGSIRFSSQGKGVEDIFAAMKGKADLSIDHRPDQNWQRPAVPGDQLRVSGEAAMVIEKQRITGLQISELAIDSELQNLTGTVSIVEGRRPWLEAELISDKLDLASLLKQSPPSAADAPDSFSLDSLKQLGESRFTLTAKSLLITDTPLSKVSLKVSTAPNGVTIEQLDFSLGQGHLGSQGEISWQKGQASFSLDARVTDMRLDKFLADTPSAANAPLSGTVSLRSTGDTVSSLLAELTGDIQLATGPDNGSAASGAPARIDMTARQTANGMHAVIHRFQWEGTDLAGSVQYHATEPPLVEVEISGGSLSLLPWETDESDPAQAAGKKEEGSIVTRTAKASVDLLGDVVLAPLRLVSGPREAKPGDKLFSTTPLPLDALKKYHARIKGKLDMLTSREGDASDLEFSASLLNGQLAVQVSAGTLNQGSGSATATIDASAQPASLTLKGTFQNLKGSLVKAGFSRTGYFDVSSHGQSQAELAANTSGLVYLELGPGTLDYSNMMLLTADVATSVFQTLIPGTDKTQPQLECAVTLGVFKDGLGATPYGYAARTNQANLAGKVEIDLKKELIHMNFSSSSRKGLGLSVGNVFSNTIEIEGSITDPKIIPNTTGLLWRGWAAVMTGGLSVVGESVLKRALASEDPCMSVKKHIHKDFCGTATAATASSMVCPPA